MRYQKEETQIYEFYSSIEQRAVEWLWYPYIPYGKITVLQGDPGDGKSTFALNIAALLTQGKAMPDGFKGTGPQVVMYQCARKIIRRTQSSRDYLQLEQTVIRLYTSSIRTSH